jgi:hypothetical protein
VEAPELKHIHDKLAEHADFEKPSFTDYKPHATIAYVKPEAAAKYVGDRTTDGKRFTVDRIAVSDRDGGQTEIPLTGQKVGEDRSSPTEMKGGRGQSPEPAGAAQAAPSQSQAPRWRAGKQATPVEAQHPDGKWEVGTLRHWSPGYNGLPPQGRVETASGKMLRGLPQRSLRTPESQHAAPAAQPVTTTEAVRPIGPPIGGEVGDMVKQRIAAGEPVKIFSRRVSVDPNGEGRRAIESWTKQHFGVALPVTDVKDAGDGAIYDDSSNVEHNTGRILAHTTNPGDRNKPVLVDLDGTLAREPDKPAAQSAAPPDGGRRGSLLRRWRTT